MHGLYVDNEAVSELTHTQNINEKLATFRLCTLFIFSIIFFLMSNSCIREDKRCIRKLYFAHALRDFLCSLFLHAKGGYGGVDKHYVMGIESGIKQLILIYVF